MPYSKRLFWNTFLEQALLGQLGLSNSYGVSSHTIKPISYDSQRNIRRAFSSVENVGAVALLPTCDNPPESITNAGAKKRPSAYLNIVKKFFPRY